MISKYAPKREKYLIDINDIPEEIRKIEHSDDYYASRDGNIYREYLPDRFYKLKQYYNPHNGYMYIAMVQNGTKKTYRAHIKIAECFIENPQHLPIVGHKNNIRSDNRVENLYWTTWRENIQKAVDEGRLINDKGADDSQSVSIICFDMNKKALHIYGSISEAYRALGVSKSTITRQSNHKISGTPRCGYYFRYKTEYDQCGFVL